MTREELVELAIEEQRLKEYVDNLRAMPVASRMEDRACNRVDFLIADHKFRESQRDFQAALVLYLEDLDKE